MRIPIWCAFFMMINFLLPFHVHSYQSEDSEHRKQRVLDKIWNINCISKKSHAFNNSGKLVKSIPIKTKREPEEISTTNNEHKTETSAIPIENVSIQHIENAFPKVLLQFHNKTVHNYAARLHKYPLKRGIKSEDEMAINQTDNIEFSIGSDEITDELVTSVTTLIPKFHDRRQNNEKLWDQNLDYDGSLTSDENFENGNAENDFLTVNFTRADEMEENLLLEHTAEAIRNELESGLNENSTMNDIEVNKMVENNVTIGDAVDLETTTAEVIMENTPLQLNEKRKNSKVYWDLIGDTYDEAMSTKRDFNTESNFELKSVNLQNNDVTEILNNTSTKPRNDVIQTSTVNDTEKNMKNSEMFNDMRKKVENFWDFVDITFEDTMNRVENVNNTSDHKLINFPDSEKRIINIFDYNTADEYKTISSNTSKENKTEKNFDFNSEVTMKNHISDLWEGLIEEPPDETIVKSNQQKLVTYESITRSKNIIRATMRMGYPKYKLEKKLKEYYPIPVTSNYKWRKTEVKYNSNGTKPQDLLKNILEKYVDKSGIAMSEFFGVQKIHKLRFNNRMIRTHSYEEKEKTEDSTTKRNKTQSISVKSKTSTKGIMMYKPRPGYPKPKPKANEGEVKPSFNKTIKKIDDIIEVEDARVLLEQLKKKLESYDQGMNHLRPSEGQHRQKNVRTADATNYSDVMKQIVTILKEIFERIKKVCIWIGNTIMHAWDKVWSMFHRIN